MAASIPASTSARLPLPLNSRYLAASSVSREMLTLLTPLARSWWARGASRVALVLRPMSVTPGSLFSSPMNSATFRRTSGSPPVTRNFVTPREVAMRATRRISS